MPDERLNERLPEWRGNEYVLATAIPDERERDAYKWISVLQTPDDRLIYSYRNNETGNYLHVTDGGQFLDRTSQPITREQALDHARHDHRLNQELSQ